LYDCGLWGCFVAYGVAWPEQKKRIIIGLAGLYREQELTVTHAIREKNEEW